MRFEEAARFRRHLEALTTLAHRASRLSQVVTENNLVIVTGEGGDRAAHVVLSGRLAMTRQLESAEAAREVARVRRGQLRAIQVETGRARRAGGDDDRRAMAPGARARRGPRHLSQRSASGSRRAGELIADSLPLRARYFFACVPSPVKLTELGELFALLSIVSVPSRVPKRGGREPDGHDAFGLGSERRAAAAYHREIAAGDDARKRDRRGLALVLIVTLLGLADARHLRTRPCRA